MTYTEIITRNDNKYYYRAKSVRLDSKIQKIKVYVGKNLSNEKLERKIKSSDKEVQKKEYFLKIKHELQKQGIKKAGIFGSYARGEQKKNSDIDVLIDAPKGMGFEFFGLEEKLEKRTKKKVDLVTYNSLNKHLKEDILKDEVRLL